MLLDELENLNRNLTFRYSNLEDRNEQLQRELKWLNRNNNGLVGVKGTDQYDAGYVYAPRNIRFKRV